MMRQIIIKMVLAFLIMNVCLTVLLYGAYCIPNRAVTANILNSTDILREEGLYPTKYVNNYFFRLDNYSDFRMMDIAISGDENSPFKSAFFNYEDYGEGDMADGIDAIANGYKVEEHNPYSRYWHSYLIYLKPLLLVFTYSGIRVLNYILFFVALLSLLYLIAKKIGKDVALLLLIALLPFNPFLIPQSMFYMICFMVMIISSLIVVGCDRWNDGPNIYVLFFIIGGLISSLDLLSTPQITYVIPFIFYCLYKQPKKPIFSVFTTGFSWLIGYVSIWASKFLIGYFATGSNLLADAVEVAQVRTSSSISTAEGEVDLSFSVLSQKAIDVMNGHWSIAVICFVLFVILIVVFLKLRKPWPVVKSNMYLLLIALVVPCWFILLRNHSIQHLFFTHRAWLATLFPILLFIYKSITIRMVKKN